MASTAADPYPGRVRTTTSTSGTGAITLDIAARTTAHRTTAQAVADGSLSDGDTVCYLIIDSTITGDCNFELGIGTFTHDVASPTISRSATHVIDGHNGPGVLWSLPVSGSRDVFIMSPHVLGIWGLQDGRIQVVTEGSRTALWVFGNARWVESSSEFQLIDTSEEGFGIQIVVDGDLPGESEPGICLYRAVPASNPITGATETYYGSGGWEKRFIMKYTGILEVAGQELAVLDDQGSGSPYARLIHEAGESYFARNVDTFGSSDDSGEPSWRIGYPGDYFQIARAAATAGTPSFSELLKVDNAGLVTVTEKLGVGGAPAFALDLVSSAASEQIARIQTSAASSTATLQLQNNSQAYKVKVTGNQLIFRDNSLGDDIVVFSPAIIILNNEGDNVDTQVKGSTDENLGYFDASANSFGVGESTPDAKLHVSGDTIIEDDLSLYAGAATAAIAARFGASKTEGLEVRVIDETASGLTAISTDLTQDIPDGAVILSSQANIEVLCVAGGTSTKVGVGPTSDPDKYGLSADLLKNTKIDLMIDWAVLSGAEDIQINACDNSGALGDTAFSAGSVRVRIVFLALNSLDDSP